MKRCSCEHWQICPTCYPQGFDEHGVRKPVEVPPSREELQRQAVALREQVEKLSIYKPARRTEQQQDPVKRIGPCNFAFYGIVETDEEFAERAGTPYEQNA